MNTLTAQLNTNAKSYDDQGLFVTGSVVGDIGGVVSHHGVSGNKSDWRSRANSKPTVVTRNNKQNNTCTKLVKFVSGVVMPVTLKGTFTYTE